MACRPGASRDGAAAGRNDQECCCHPDHMHLLKVMTNLQITTVWVTGITDRVGHSAMLYLHSSTGADNDLGERFVRAFNAAAQDADLPADPEFRAALTGYMEYAVAEVAVAVVRRTYRSLRQPGLCQGRYHFAKRMNMRIHPESGG